MTVEEGLKRTVKYNLEHGDMTKYYISPVCMISSENTHEKRMVYSVSVSLSIFSEN